MASSSGATRKPEDRFVWVDIETTGLTDDLPKATILELGIIVTDWNLNEIARFRQVIGAGWDHGRAEDEMPTVVYNMHYQSTLLDQLDEDNTTMSIAEFKAVDWLVAQGFDSAPRALGPMCGSSVHTDRQFISQWMPGLHRLFHYRNIDVSTVTELAERWAPEIAAAGRTKRDNHTTMDDLEDSIGILAFLMDNFMFVTLPNPEADDRTLPA